MEKKAVRNLRLCTKDCLCLYVCPTGATDTENSIIDVSRCIGCGDCAAACPSGAISMVPAVYPEQQEKKEEVCFALNALIEAKAEEEMTAASLARKTEKAGLRRLMKAVTVSARLSGEDLAREAGYMLPQGSPALALLKELRDNPPSDDFPLNETNRIIEAFKGE